MNMVTIKKKSLYVIGVAIFSVIYFHQNHVDTIQEALQFKHLKYIVIFFLVQCFVYVLREHFISKKK